MRLTLKTVIPAGTRMITDKVGTRYRLIPAPRTAYEDCRDWADMYWETFPKSWWSAQSPKPAQCPSLGIVHSRILEWYGDVEMRAFWEARNPV